MMRIVEIAWLVVATLSLIEVIAQWETRGQRFYIFLGFLIVAILMYFLRRGQRRRFERRQKEQGQ